MQRHVALVVVVLFALALGATRAHAVPSYADQTGQACTVCHVGGFGPRLTPFGRAFKLGGYTDRVAESMPLSAMAVASYLNTAKAQPPPPAPHYSTNDNLTLDQASAFLAGGIGDHFGGFIQATYDGVGRSFSWDNLDLRAVTTTSLVGSDLLLGLSFNNSPSVQDVWNTDPAWGFPFTDSALAPSPDAAPLIADALAQNVLGLSAYAWVDSRYYAEFGLYRSPGTRFLSAMGVDPDDTDRIDGSAPYVRLAYEQDMGGGNFQIGGFGLFADLFPGRDASTGKADSYSDLGLDASYQFLRGDNTYIADARYTHEHRNLAASFALGDAANSRSTLEDLRADVAYYWRNTIGGTFGIFDTWSSRDALLYADDRTLAPDSSGVTLQADWTPFAEQPSGLGTRLNLRLGLQYILYTRFDGASRNYDGSGRNASDNNTLRLFLWSAF